MALLDISKTALGTTAGIFGTATTDDYLFGTSGDDIITGGAATIAYLDDGIDIMQGGLGDDRYIVNNPTGTNADVVIEYANEGTDTIFSSVTYTLPSEVENIVSTSIAAVTLTGNLKDNILDASQNSVADTLRGMEGNDTYILGAVGDRIIEGKGGIGTILTYSDTGGIDTIISKVATTLIDLSTNATGQADTAATGTVTTTNRNFSTAPIVGVAFIENVILDNAATTSGITGNAKNNTLTGNNVANTINGGAGNDILDGGLETTAALDALTGGAGNDTFIQRDLLDTFSEALNGGIDTIISTVTTTASTNIENITLNGIGIINATGNILANVIKGNSAANTLIGGAGVDTLFGLQGADTLNGGTGADIMAGGRENDTYIVDNSGDVVTELQNTGQTGAATNTNGSANGTADLVQSSANYSLNTTAAAGVENLTLTGQSSINGTGNALANVLLGNDSGNNILNGGVGADDLQGLGGNDTYVVDNVLDKVSDTAGTADTVISSVSYDLSQGTTGAISGTDTNVENLTLTGTAIINATGNNSDNIIIGNASANTIDGGLGADFMQGAAGDDIYVVNTSADKVTDTAGVDLINTSATFNMATSGSGVENLSAAAATGVTGLTLTGNTLANTITGNDVANTILGGAGNDTISAGAGVDTITGGAGKDTITTGTGADTISFAAGVTDTVATATSVAGIDLYSDLVFTAGTGDKIGLSVTVASVGIAVSGSISEATFVTNMNTALAATSNGTGFKVGSADITAAIVTATGGLTGAGTDQKFLAVDLDSSGTFTATDFVIEITGSTITSLTAATFI